MSNVASLELCKELYELSGWESEYTWAENSDGDSNPHIVNSDSGYLGHNIYRLAYAYDLGYLLRKLPAYIDADADSFFNADLFLETGVAETWKVGYRVGAAKPRVSGVGDTPEDAAAKLAVELLKSGVLTKEHEGLARATPRRELQGNE